MSDALRIEIGGEAVEGTATIAGDLAEIAFVRAFDAASAARVSSLFAQVELRRGADVAFRGEARVVTLYRSPQKEGCMTVLVAAQRSAA